MHGHLNVKYYEYIHKYTQFRRKGTRFDKHFPLRKHIFFTTELEM